MKRRLFTAQDQYAFALCSGDHNPLHIDEIYARRLIFGSSITHGIHLVLWSIDCWLHEANFKLIELDYIHAVFFKPAKTGEYINLDIVALPQNLIRFSIYSTSELLAKIEIRFSEKINKTNSAPIFKHPPIQPPKNLLMHTIEGCKGSLPLFLDKKLLTKLLPDVVNKLEENQLATLLATTRLVGNECPGLHSIYTELKLNKNLTLELPELEYAVQKVDSRVNLASLTVRSANLEGEIKSFIRPQPYSQPSLEEVKTLVLPNEFSNQRALIIGGSRGLGELTAKILSAGGADLQLTYASGKNDASRVIDELNIGNQKFKAFHLDILSNLTLDNLAKSASNWNPTHLYYFATPHIATGIPGKFSRDLFSQYCEYYVYGFMNLANLCKEMGIKKIFNPSSVMIEKGPKNLLEYSVAKTAGERAGIGYQSANPSFSIYQPRLPKMSTDQTTQIASTSERSQQDDISIILEEIRIFNDL